jgi:hypothetical protein
MQQLTININEQQLSAFLEKITIFDSLEIVNQVDLLDKKKTKKANSSSIPTLKNGKAVNLEAKSIENVSVESKDKKWTKKQQQIYNDIKEGLEIVELHRQGKIQLKTADQFMKELWPE